MTENQIEKYLKRNAVALDIHYSGLSKSVYFSFYNDEDDYMIIRLSDHELPITYQNREHRNSFDVRFTDSWTEFKTKLQAFVSVKKLVRKPVQKVFILNDDEIQAFKKDLIYFNNDFEKMCRIDGIKGKKQKEQVAKQLHIFL